MEISGVVTPGYIVSNTEKSLLITTSDSSSEDKALLLFELENGKVGIVSLPREVVFNSDIDLNKFLEDNEGKLRKELKLTSIPYSIVTTFWDDLTSHISKYVETFIALIYPEGNFDRDDNVWEQDIPTPPSIDEDEYFISLFTDNNSRSLGVWFRFEGDFYSFGVTDWNIQTNLQKTISYYSAYGKVFERIGEGKGKVETKWERQADNVFVIQNWDKLTRLAEYSVTFAMVKVHDFFRMISQSNPL